MITLIQQVNGTTTHALGTAVYFGDGLCQRFVLLKFVGIFDRRIDDQIGGHDSLL